MPGDSWPEPIDLARDYLESAGMTILNRLWKNDSGESGVIASDHGVFVVCQVQARAGARQGTPPGAVPRTKARELRQIAEAWLKEHELPSAEVRVDMVVAYEGTGGYTIEHIKDAALAADAAPLQ
jgi:putative endonuclease